MKNDAVKHSIVIQTNDQAQGTGLQPIMTENGLGNANDEMVMVN